VKKQFGVAVMTAAMAWAGLAKAESSQTLLKIGDPAPALAGGKWLKGDPIEKLEPGKIYVVEFWATWCGPCKEAIPHVTEMQKTYAKDGVTFIGQDVWEHDQAKPEPFVQQMGDKMDYHVRMDSIPKDGDGTDGVMANTWMAAAGRNGIPCTFVIGKDGKIAWIGHPMELEPVLKQVIAGTFDSMKAAADSAASQSKMSPIAKAMMAKDWDAALAATDDMEKAGKLQPAQAASLRFRINLQKKDYPAARAAALKAIDAHAEAKSLDLMAFNLATTKEKENLALANQLAAEAVKSTGGTDFKAIYSQAALYYLQGDTANAEIARKAAIDAAPENVKASLSNQLERLSHMPTTAPAH
jgi:thiol-disulfide isomerase/thioredoxin